MLISSENFDVLISFLFKLKSEPSYFVFSYVEKEIDSSSLSSSSDSKSSFLFSFTYFGFLFKDVEARLLLHALNFFIAAFFYFLAILNNLLAALLAYLVSAFSSSSLAACSFFKALAISLKTFCLLVHDFFLPPSSSI